MRTSPHSSPWKHHSPSDLSFTQGITGLRVGRTAGSSDPLSTQGRVAKVVFLAHESVGFLFSLFLCLEKDSVRLPQARTVGPAVRWSCPVARDHQPRAGYAEPNGPDPSARTTRPGPTPTCTRDWAVGGCRSIAERG